MAQSSFKKRPDGFVLNTNEAEYREFCKQREELRHTQQTKKELSDVKNELAEMKELIRKLLEKK